MPLADMFIVIKWWIMFLLIGTIFLPLTTSLFSIFFDKGYVFSKIIGIAILSYAVFLLGTLKILPFTFSSILLILLFFFSVNLFLISKYPNILISIKQKWKIFAFEEILFIVSLLFWSYIRAHQPDIHGLEKFMDFGFVNSILRANYFPPHDMWFTPFPINYYYFGHLVTAVLTKLSQIPSSITFNLMIATIFALTLTASFSIGANLISKLNAKRYMLAASGGLLTAFLVSFAGNLHTIYSFFLPYQNGNPVPFWQLLFSISTFPNAYWYPNATRFIYNTIHEFPIYSSVVSDLHGHFLDIPFVLLTIALLLSIFLKIENFKLKIPLISFLLAVLYMTNAWDGIIYFFLTAIIIVFIRLKQNTYYILLVLIGFFLFSLPFNLNFKPFASGIGILCSPKFLTDIGRFGPFLFETNHCQRSPLWQLFILYGFFYFWTVLYLINLNFIKNLKLKIKNLLPSDIFILILISISTILIILPEFIYIKDIYPAHYRANTMFKLVYQSFIMLSISSGYIIVRVLLNLKLYLINRHYLKLVVFVIGIIGLFLVGIIYPYFAIKSYYVNLQIYYGLDGTRYLKNLYSTDYQAIQWLNKNIKGQPIILEAQGDSYTDFARISANTGLPTVLGWTVHEWLWRGTYDIPAPRINEVKILYETDNTSLAKELIDKYNISFVFIGDLERQKYTSLNEDKFKKFGKLVYQSGQTRIYKINSAEF